MTKSRLGRALTAFAPIIIANDAYLSAGDIFTFTRINQKYIAFVNEQRNLNRKACFNGCVFGRAGCCVAFNAGLSFNNLQINTVWQCNTDNFVL